MTTDQPSYRMIVQNGRLVPAGPLDQERLMTYANGTEVECVWKSVKNGVLIRKLHAVVGLAVKQCATPWKTSDEAIQAMKSVLGLVEYGSGMHGEQMRYLRSLNDVDEPELLEFMEGCWLILQKVTGVDPLTLRKEAGDTTSGQSSPADDPGCVPSGESQRDDGGSGEVGGNPASPAADQSEIADDAPEQLSDGRAHSATEAGTEPSPAPASTIPPDDKAALQREMLAKLFRLAAEPLSVDDRIAALATVRPIWADKLDADTVRLAFDTVEKVVRGELPTEAARRFLDC